MPRMLLLAFVMVAAVISGGCYVTQDETGQWWACEAYMTPNGPATGCTPIEQPVW